MWIVNAWHHFKTITKHRLKVRKYCFKAGLIRQGLVHDLSKYSWVEFSEGAKFYQGMRSPNARAREVNGISYAWLHHKGRNRHHLEYWIDYDPDSPMKLSGHEMPRKYVAEMAIDRICACQVYRGENYKSDDAYKYYLNGCDKIWFINEKTKQDLKMLLYMTAEHGEEYTMKYIKNVYLKTQPDHEGKPAGTNLENHSGI